MQHRARKAYFYDVRNTQSTDGERYGVWNKKFAAYFQFYYEKVWIAMWWTVVHVIFQAFETRMQDDDNIERISEFWNVQLCA